MIWNEHLRLIGSHAFLGASKYHWINYDDRRLKESYKNFLAAAKGTELHEFAATCIRLKQKLPRSTKTLNSYVNDAIQFRMTPEQVLFYSENCYGTADSISFEDNLLRIHDLKTGASVIKEHRSRKPQLRGLMDHEFVKALFVVLEEDLSFRKIQAFHHPFQNLHHMGI